MPIPNLTTLNRQEIETSVNELREGEIRWAETPLAERAELLTTVGHRSAQYGQDWVDAARAIKDLDETSSLLGEEWITGPYALASGAHTLAHSVRALSEGRSPLDGLRVSSNSHGRTTIQVLPHSIFESLLLSGFQAEVVLKHGIGPSEASAKAGLAQRDSATTNGIGLVLGAGNIMSIAPLDVLYELIACNRVVVLKLNPVTNPLLSVFRKILEPLIQIGALRIITGGGEVGSYLAHHPAVNHVHMTGSAETHDRIVWGDQERATDRRAADEPLLNKPISSELGGVSPTIVIPGRWSTSDLRYQARHVATQRLHNGGYNCVATQVVIVPAEWDLKDAFLHELRSALKEAPQRSAYYPGSDARMDQARRSFPTATDISGNRLLVEVSDPVDATPLLQTEYFAPVLGVVELPGDATEFIRAAAEFANTRIRGTLGINIIAKPATIADLGDTFDEVLEILNYGTIAVNAWTGVGFLTAGATWGAYPGHTLDDVQSGIGIVHNAFLIDGAEKTVVRGPFRPFPRSFIHGEWAMSPTPPWFVDNRTARVTGRRLTMFAGKPTWAKLPGIFVSALRADLPTR